MCGPIRHGRPRPLVKKIGAILVPNIAQNTGFWTLVRLITLLES